MIKELFYKDRPAIAITNGETTATFLPLDGAKLVSLKDKNGNEFMAQADGEKYLRLGLDTSYIAAECSAFDDMFPTIDPCQINGMEYLDHGEVARREHLATVCDDRVKFSCELEKLNIVYEKAVYFSGDELAIEYRIKNNNPFDFPYIYAGHMMFRGETGVRALCSLENNSQKEIMFGIPTDTPDVLCEKGAAREWKYYYKDSVSPLICSVKYPISRQSVSVKCMDSAIRYLGVWMNPGDLNGMYNIALEPCTALYDSPLKAKETCSYIKAGEEIEFTLKISVESEE